MTSRSTGSQILSVLGDRVTRVALLFAATARFLPFVVLAVPAGRSSAATCRCGGFGLLGLLTGVCVTGMFAPWETSLGEHIPPRALSRVSSYDYLASTGMIPLGNVLVGGLAAVLGSCPALMVMTVCGTGAAVVVVSTPAVRRLPRGTHGGEVAVGAAT
ncbi:MAG TPA: hypothetical protein VHW64_06285 [Nocardioides sp.]|uniref:hypothetical protein n=1 Tax=Nocardioides sp. TaxID=35761 RepID=UPI002E34635D|nr:hypothetical protein [Nocardioides sp.]HEX3930293.1 hypothetical protein [Nocardioides sp.]